MRDAIGIDAGAREKWAQKRGRIDGTGACRVWQTVILLTLTTAESGMTENA
jgi:hypothetical protein